MPEKPIILVVDDNEEFCQNVKDVLELRDYEVVTAGDGFEALQMVELNGFALVLMDVRMPVIDGVETFKRLKEMAPNMPVIMVTAYTVEDLIKETLRAGAFGALKKPLDFDRLFELMEKAIANETQILVVDDDTNLCNNMRDVLSAQDYRVDVAYDGNTAIGKAWENNFDIMLIDLKLPPLNGLETYLSLRDFRPNMVTIVITGYSLEMSNLVERAKQEGAYLCLEKPLNMDELVALLEPIRAEKARGISQKPK